MKHLICFLLAACGPVPQQALRYPAVAIGTPGSFEVGGWTVALSEARVAVGPVYFCPGNSASPQQCGTALAEILSVSTVDALSAEAQPLGEVSGLSGTVRSLTYDYGISWLTTEPAATTRTELAHSARFLGVATRGADSFSFSAELDVAPQAAGTHAVMLNKTGAEVQSGDVALEVQLSPALWWGAVDFDALYLSASNGHRRLVADDVATSTLIVQMTANAPPTFTWSKK